MNEFKKLSVEAFRLLGLTSSLPMSEPQKEETVPQGKEKGAGLQDPGLTA